MEELGIWVLDEGVDVEQVAAAAVCCKTGPAAFKTAPEA